MKMTPYGDGAFEIAFDFIDHTLVIDMSDGRRRTIALVPGAVADFYGEFLCVLDDLQIEVGGHELRSPHGEGLTL